MQVELPSSLIPGVPGVVCSPQGCHPALWSPAAHAGPTGPLSPALGTPATAGRELFPLLRLLETPATTGNYQSHAPVTPVPRPRHELSRIAPRGTSPPTPSSTGVPLHSSSPAALLFATLLCSASRSPAAMEPAEPRDPPGAPRDACPAWSLPAPPRPTRALPGPSSWSLLGSPPPGSSHALQ